MLARPVRLEVQVVPAADPQGEAWRLQLSAGSQILKTTQASAKGLITLDRLRPDEYRMLLLDGRNSVWLARMVRVEQGQEPLRIELSFARLEGRLLYGEAPAAGTVWFSQKGDDANPHLEADESGVLSGHLPRAGDWDVRAALDREGGRVPVGSVDITPDETGTAHADVVVPRTVVEGAVLDGANRPVTDAHVAARPQGFRGPSVAVYTDERAGSR